MYYFLNMHASPSGNILAGEELDHFRTFRLWSWIINLATEVALFFFHIGSIEQASKYHFIVIYIFNDSINDKLWPSIDLPVFKLA